MNLERSRKLPVDATRGTSYAWLIEGDWNGSQSKKEIDEENIGKE